MSLFQVLAANPYGCTHSLANATAVTITFPTPVTAVEIQTNIDAYFTAKFGAAAPSTAGTNSAPVAGYDKLCPAYGVVVLMTNRGNATTTLGLYNLTGATVVFHVNGWPSGGGMG